MGMVASERVFKVLDNEDYIKSEGDYHPGKMEGKIEFDHVWFSYVANRYVLKDINFRIEPGEKRWLLWAIPAVKNIYHQFIEQDVSNSKGAIMIDGISIQDTSWMLKI